MNMSDSEDYEGDSDAEEDLSIRSIEVTRAPAHDDLMTLLECPVCFDLPLPPIRTCCQGHIICTACIPRLRQCPLCLQHIGTGRNYFAEDFLNKSIMRCKYYEDGCPVQLEGAKIRDHVDGCYYRPLKCRQCNKKVAFADIDQHLLRQHGIGRWDLNDEGSRILMCHKFRSRIPNASVIDNWDRNNGTVSRFTKVFLIVSALLSFVLLDFVLIDDTDLGLNPSIFSSFYDSVQFLLVSK